MYSFEQREKYEKLLNSTNSQLGSSYTKNPQERTELEKLGGRLAELRKFYDSHHLTTLENAKIVANKLIKERNLPKHLSELSTEDLERIVNQDWFELRRRLEAVWDYNDDKEMEELINQGLSHDEDDRKQAMPKRPEKLFFQTWDLFEEACKACDIYFASLRWDVRHFVEFRERNGNTALGEVIKLDLEGLQFSLVESEMNEVMNLMIRWLANFHVDALRELI